MKEVIISELIKNTKRMNELLTELESSIEAEKHRWVMKKEYQEVGTEVWSLYDRENDEVLIDKKHRLESYCKIRNITDIYFHNQ